MCNRTILIALLALAAAASAQRWEYHYGDPERVDNYYFQACAVEPNGSGYYGGGDSYFPERTRFSVVALSSAGAVRWVAADYTGSVEDVCIGEDGLIYAAGVVIEPDSSRRFAVLCYDRWGGRRWVYKAGEAEGLAGLAYAVEPRPGGGVYAGGYVDVPGRWWDFAVAALDASGTELWLDTLGGTSLGGEYVEDLCVGTDGHIYACGYLTDLQWPVGALVSLTAAGAVRWTKSDSLFYPLAICSGDDGNIYVAGASGQQQQPDIAARSFTPDGSPRWSYSYDPGGRGSLDLDHASDLVWGDGNIYIGGQGCRNDDYIDAFICSLDPQGRERWQYWFRGPYNHFNWVSELVFSPDGYIHGAGLMCSLLGSVAEWCLTPGGDTVWVFKRDSEGPNSAGAGCIACDSAGNVYVGGNRYTDARDAWAGSLTRHQTTVGGDRTDHAYAVAPLADSGFVVVAETRSYGAGTSDGWVLRLDRAGDTVWTRTAGGSGTDVLRDVAFAADGGYVGAGDFDNDPWLVKLDAGGEQAWSRVYSVPHFGRLHAVHAVPDGFVVAGSKYNGANYMFGIVIGTDSAGNEAWRTELGEGSNYSYLDDIADCPGGGYLLVGHWQDVSSSNGDLWLARLDAGGDTVWTRKYGGSGNDWGAAVVPAEDGGYVVVGTTRSFGPGTYNVWLLGIDESGDTLWTRTWGTAGEASWGRDLVAVPGRGYAVTGDHNIWSGTDILLLETDVNGNELELQGYGGDNDEKGEGICLGHGGGYCIVGSTLSFGTVGSEDVYIVTTASGVGIAEPRPDPIPRPHEPPRLSSTIVRGVLNLPRGMDAGHDPFRPGEMESCPNPMLVDASGRRVVGLKPGPNDVSRLAPGVYFVAEYDARGTAHVCKVVLAR